MIDISYAQVFVFSIMLIDLLSFIVDKFIYLRMYQKLNKRPNALFLIECVDILEP